VLVLAGLPPSLRPEELTMSGDAPQDPCDEFFASIGAETKKTLPDDPAVPSSAGADSQSVIGSDSREPIEFSYKAPVPIGSDEIGGLLPFVVWIVVVSPLASFVFILLWFVEMFSEGIWAAYTTPGSEQYHVLAAPLLIIELIVEVVIFAALVLGVYLYFCKSRAFPKFFIALMLVDLCLPLLGAWLWSFATPHNPLYHTDWVSILAWPFTRAVILVPYMMLSKQVQNIFVE
jgi:hypothetical protein